MASRGPSRLATSGKARSPRTASSGRPRAASRPKRCYAKRRPSRHLLMPFAPSEFTLELTPKARVDVIDVRRRVSDRFGDALDAYKRVLCCSFHTTAGYLDPSVASRLNQSRTGVMPYIELFRT